jgi:hypothetical protein
MGREFKVDVTKEGNCYPDKITIEINKKDIFIRELKVYTDKYQSDEELVKILRGLVNEKYN